MKYVVGQVLYVVFKKDHKVVPVQVIEEITRKTLDGLKVDYTVRVGSSSDTTIELNNLLSEGEIFDTPDHAIEVLTSRAKSSIIKLVNSAVEKATAWYPISNKIESVSLDEDDQIVPLTTLEKNNNEERVTVTLPDGTVARVKLPQVG